VNYTQIIAKLLNDRIEIIEKAVFKLHKTESTETLENYRVSSNKGFPNISLGESYGELCVSFLHTDPWERSELIVGLSPKELDMSVSEFQALDHKAIHEERRQQMIKINQK
jgi:hypothetical protein